MSTEVPHKAFPNAYSLENIFVYPSFDSKTPYDSIVHTFLYATDQYDYRKQSNKRKQSIIRKYQEGLARAVQRKLNSKKQPPSIETFFLKFPEASQALEENQNPLLPEIFIFLIANLVNEKFAIITLHDGVATNVNEFTAELPIILVEKVLDDKSNDKFLSIAAKDDEDYLFIFPSNHPVNKTIRTVVQEPVVNESITLDMEDQTQIEIYHVDELEFEPFEGDLEVERVAPVSAKQMNPDHLIAELQNLLPENPDISQYVQMLYDDDATHVLYPHSMQSIVQIVSNPKFDDHEHFIENMAEFKRFNPAKPYIQPFFTSLPGTPMHIDTRENVIVDDIRQKITKFNIIEDDDIEVGDIMERFKTSELIAYAVRFGLRPTGTKTVLSNKLKPYWPMMMKEQRKMQLGQCLEEEEHPPPLYEDEETEPLHPHFSIAMLREDTPYMTGLVHRAPQNHEQELIQFDVDQYLDQLNQIQPNTKCTLLFFDRESFSEIKGTVTNSITQQFIKIKCEDNEDRFLNLANLTNNYFFLYKENYQGTQFNKPMLLSHNIIFWSNKHDAKTIRSLVCMTVAQFVHMYSIRQIGIDGTLDTFDRVNQYFEHTFHKKLLDMHYKDYEPVRKHFLNEIVTDRIPKTKKDVKEIPEESLPNFLQDHMFQEKPSSFLLERLHLSHKSHTFMFAVHSNFRKKTETVSFTPPPKATQKYDKPIPPPSNATFEEIEQYRNDAREYYDQKACNTLRKNYQRLMISYNNSEELEKEHAALAQQYADFLKRKNTSEPSKIFGQQHQHLRIEGEVDDWNAIKFVISREDDNATFPVLEPADVPSTTVKVHEVLRIPLNKTEQHFVESDAVKYSAFLINLYKRTNKKKTSTSTDTIFAEYALVCARVALLTIIVLHKQQLIPLIPHLASFFALDGPPLTDLVKAPKNVVIYFVHAIKEHMQNRNVFTANLKQMAQHVVFILEFYMKNNPSALKMLKRKIENNTDTHTPLQIPSYKPAPTSPVLSTLKSVHRSIKNKTVDSSFVMYPSTEPLRSTLGRPSKLLQVKNKYPHPYKPVKQEIVFQSTQTIPVIHSSSTTNDTQTEKELDEELTSLVDQMQDELKISMDKFIQYVTKDPAPRNYRINLNPEIILFLKEENLSNPNLFERLAQNHRHKSILFNAVECLRSVTDIFIELFGSTTAESTTITPEIISQIENFKRIITTGIDRIAAMDNIDIIEEDTLKERTDILREEEKQRQLDHFKDMTMEERLTAKMMKEIGMAIKPNDTEIPANNDLNDDFYTLPDQDNEDEQTY
jgi:hypothetical protein